MADDFFAAMLAGDAATQFHSEIGGYVNEADSLLNSLSIPTGTLTPESIAAMQETINLASSQLELKRQLNDLVKQYFRILTKIAEEENKCRQLGIDFSTKLLELRAEAAKAWATYQGEVRKLTQGAKNDVEMIGYKAGKEVSYLQFAQQLALQKEDERLFKRQQIAQARHEDWVIKIRESINAAIAKFSSGSSQQLPAGQARKVFGIFEGKKAS